MSNVNCLNHQTQIASIMDILSKAAISEISKVVDDGFVSLRLEMCRKENEVESLKMKIQSLESELRTAGRLGGKTPVYSLGIKLTRAGQKGGADYGEKTPFDRMPFVKDCDPHPTPATEEQVTQPTPIKDGKKPDTEPTPAGEPMELERVFGQEWSVSLSRDGDLAGVAQVDSPLQSGVTQNQSANIGKVGPEPALIKQESLEEDLCYSDPQPTAATEEQVTQPTPVEDGKKVDTEPTPAGDPEELSEQHRCEYSDEELSGLEFVVKAEQEEEHVAQRLNQTGYEHSAGRLNNLGSEYVMYERDSQLWTSFTQGDSDQETDGPVCSNATEQCSQSLSVRTWLQNSPAPMEVSGKMLSSFGVGENLSLSVRSEHLRSEVINRPQGQCRIRRGSLTKEDVVSQYHQPQIQPQFSESNPDAPDGVRCAPQARVEMRGKAHVGAGTDEKRFSCAQCGNSFTTRHSLKIHRRIHTGERPFNCAQCGRSFYCTSHLTSHQRSHTGEKPYNCALCGKSFTTREYLKIHRRIHTGEKRFSCAQCGKCFTTCHYLKIHRRIHTGEKRFSCTQCGKSFTNRPYLKIHQRIHTGERPFSCAHCGKSFYCTSHLTSHQRSHTGEKPYSCDKCGYSYSCLKSFKRHYRAHADERALGSLQITLEDVLKNAAPL